MKQGIEAFVTRALKTPKSAAFLLCLLVTANTSAHVIEVIEVFDGVQYRNQLETPFKPIHPQLRLSDLSQNLTSREIESLYVFKHKIEYQKDDLHYVAELILSIAFPRLIIPF